MGLYQDQRSGNWGIRIECDGKEYKKVIGPIKRNAELALHEVKQEIRLRKLAGQKWEGFQKLQRAVRPKRFAEAAQDYLDERANYKASSLASYRSILKTHLLPEFSKLPLRSITDSQLKKFQVRLSALVSASRTNTVMQLLRSILDQSCRQGEIDRDPSRAVRRMPEPKTKIDPLSEDELELVLSNIDDHYRPLFTMLAYTGARPNEMLALRWSDVDQHSEKISITKGRVRGAEGLPKTKSAERELPITMPAKRALEELSTRPVVNQQGYVFTKRNGEPIDKHLDRIWVRALKRSGLRHRPSYQLRHTFATQCILKGLPLPYISKILGHSTIDTLIRHYAGWIDSATKQHDERLKELFSLGNSKPKVVTRKKQV